MGEQDLDTKRFTPTHVGTIWQGVLHAPTFPVHPHTRGDNSSGRASPSRIAGSPPHTWGQLIPWQAFPTILRFTPTHVGTMKASCRLRDYWAVHPHTRGDNIISQMMITRLTGSPPHTWGQFLSFIPSMIINRFTPTHVGTIS